MSEYIPTTEEILQEIIKKSLVDSWKKMHTNESYGLQEMLAYYVAHDIQPWLAEVKAEVRREEQQKSMALIGLLLAEAGGEIVISQKTQYLAHVYAIEQERNVVDGSIALRLIKGEEQ